LRYFRRHWAENRGDRYSGWGEATYFLETDGQLYPTRQMEVYENGTVLKYDSPEREDDYGFLSYVQLDAGEFAPFEITKEEFEDAWNSRVAIN
jgi:hypothetical protein